MKTRAALLLMLLAGVVAAQDCPGPRCIAIVDTKKTTTPFYSCKSIDFCAKRWTLGDWWFGRMPRCGECGALHFKNILVKYNRTNEKPQCKCVPACAERLTK